MVIQKKPIQVVFILIVIISLTISLFGASVSAISSKSALFLTDGTYTSYTINTGMTMLRDQLVNKGFSIDEFTVTGPISYDDLSDYDVVVFATVWYWSGSGRDITDAEATVFEDYVNNGGGLLLIGENTGFGNTNRSISKIGEPFGIEVNTSTDYSVIVTEFSSHPVASSVTSFYLPTGCPLLLEAPAVAVASYDGKPIIGASEYGSGRVVAIADINTFTNSFITYNDNQTLCLNIFDWLSDNVRQVKPVFMRGNHELVTLLTNPADGTGVRTMDLNYYLNDPIIWGTDVKNITVWLESEIFDLAKAQQKAKLPAGLSLLKDYNIRLMMKIVYNDGTVETREVDNAHIARNIPVLIPVDEFNGTSDLGIVYMDTQGHTAVLPVTPVTIDGMNYLQFENNHFSEYGVVSGAAMAPAEQQQYIIQPGDTLASIAAKFGKTVQSLAAANNISNLDLIYAGKVLIIA